MPPEVPREQEPPSEWRMLMQWRYHYGDSDALESLMGLPKVERMVMRAVEKYHLSGDEAEVRTRAIRSLERTHRTYRPVRPFEPWAQPQIYAAAKAQDHWRKRPRRIWSAIVPQEVSTEVEQLAADMRIELEPALEQLEGMELRVIKTYLEGVTSVSHIAGKLGLPVGKTFRIYYRSLKKLRAFYKERGDRGP